DAGRIRLLLRHGAEVIAGHAIGKARNTLDLVDAHELPAQHATREQCRTPAKPRARQGGGQARQSATDDDDVVFTAHCPRIAQARPSWQAAVLLSKASAIVEHSLRMQPQRLS